MDLLVKEMFDGGDFTMNANDLAIIFGFENVPYLSCFGGNVRQDTPVSRIGSQQAFDWWGNNLFSPNNKKLQFNSQTERALNSYPLTSSGRIAIENAIISDLSVMSDYVKVTVTTQVVSDNRLEAAVKLVKPGNLQSVTFTYIWDATMQELSIV